MVEPMDDADLASLEAIRDATNSEATRLLLTAIIDIHTGADAATVLAETAETILRKEGWVVVPREPTEDMIVAGIAERHLSGVPEAWSKATINIYRAMLEASQK